jgi:chemotaxis protein histidine kinase CheA
MADEPNNFQAKLDELMKEFEQNLPSKINQIREQWLALRNGNWELDQLSELLGLVHKIAGSGGIFGFSRISEVAHQIEYLLQEKIRSKKPINEKEMKNMEAYFEELFTAINIHDQ